MDTESAIKPDSLPEQIAECVCPKRKCPRHGYCRQCGAYHGEKGKLPYCLRKRKHRDEYRQHFLGSMDIRKTAHEGGYPDTGISPKAYKSERQ